MEYNFELLIHTDKANYSLYIYIYIHDGCCFVDVQMGDLAVSQRQRLNLTGGGGGGGGGAVAPSPSEQCRCGWFNCHRWLTNCTICGTPTKRNRHVPNAVDILAQCDPN